MKQFKHIAIILLAAWMVSAAPVCNDPEFLLWGFEVDASPDLARQPWSFSGAGLNRWKSL